MGMCSSVATAPASEHRRESSEGSECRASPGDRLGRFLRFENKKKKTTAQGGDEMKKGEKTPQTCQVCKVLCGFRLVTFSNF